MSLARLLLSRSALCIAIVDESDAQSFSGFFDLWEEFSVKFPKRPFYLFGPISNNHYVVNVESNVSTGRSIGATEFTAPRESATYDTSTFMGDVFTARKKIGSNANYTEGDALSTATGINSGFESLFYGKYADIIFPNITPFFPTSPNARASLPFTYNWGPASLRASVYIGATYDDVLSNYGVTPFSYGSPIPATDPVDHTRQYVVKYKIRIPAYTSSQNGVISDGIRFKFACNGTMNVSIYNPVTTNSILIGSNSNPTSATTVTYNGAQTESNFTPLYLHSDDVDLVMTVSYTPDEQNSYNTNPGADDSHHWDNPLVWAVTIEAFSQSLGSYVDIFNTHDYVNPYGHVYASSSDPDNSNYTNTLRVPVNFMNDAYSRNAAVEGPYCVSRDNGDTSKTTDWFTLADCGGLVPGTIIGLFVDRSGSMTQSTVNASYHKFYADCEAANLKIIEVQDTSENWILPFIAEI